MSRNWLARFCVFAFFGLCFGGALRAADSKATPFIIATATAETYEQLYAQKRTMTDNRESFSYELHKPADKRVLLGVVATVRPKFANKDASLHLDPEQISLTGPDGKPLACIGSTNRFGTAYLQAAGFNVYDHETRETGARRVRLLFDAPRDVLGKQCTLTLRDQQAAVTVPVKPTAPPNVANFLSVKVKSARLVNELPPRAGVAEKKFTNAGGKLLAIEYEEAALPMADPQDQADVARESFFTRQVGVRWIDAARRPGAVMTAGQVEDSEVRAPTVTINLHPPKPGQKPMGWTFTSCFAVPAGVTQFELTLAGQPLAKVTAR